MNTTSAAPNVPSDVLQHIGSREQLIVPLANGEPTAVLDTVEDAAADQSI